MRTIGLCVSSLELQMQRQKNLRLQKIIRGVTGSDQETIKEQRLLDAYSRGEWRIFGVLPAAWEYGQSGDGAQGGVTQLEGNSSRWKGTMHGSDEKNATS